MCRPISSSKSLYETLADRKENGTSSIASLQTNRAYIVRFEPNSYLYRTRLTRRVDFNVKRTRRATERCGKSGTHRPPHARFRQETSGILAVHRYAAVKIELWSVAYALCTLNEPLEHKRIPYRYRSKTLGRLQRFGIGNRSLKFRESPEHRGGRSVVAILSGYKLVYNSVEL